jgi:hypothetical protein
MGFGFGFAGQRAVLQRQGMADKAVESALGRCDGVSRGDSGGVSAGLSRRVSAQGHGMLEHTVNRDCWKLVAPRLSQELSTVHLRGTGGIELDRKYSWLLVSRSMMSMGPAQTGQLD